MLIVLLQLPLSTILVAIFAIAIMVIKVNMVAAVKNVAVMPTV